MLLPPLVPYCPSYSVGNHSFFSWEHPFLATSRNQKVSEDTEFQNILGTSLILEMKLTVAEASLVKHSEAQYVKHPPANAANLGLIPGSGRSPGVGNGNPLQYACLKTLMDRGAWWATVYAVTKNWTQLSNWTTTRAKIHFINWLWNIHLESRRDPSLSSSLPSWPSAATSAQLLLVKGKPPVSGWALSGEGDAQHPVCRPMLSLVLRG